jgi:hypothetical protein
MGKNAPSPPDPRETSAASTGTNVSIANAWLGNINEVGPDGSTSIARTGTESMFDPYTKKSYDIPTFTRTTQLSPQQQLIKEQQDAASLNLASLGNNLSGTLGQQLTGNFKLGNEETEARLMDLGRARLDPMLAQRREAEETRLANQGVRAGSTAYDRAMASIFQGENDAYNELLLRGRGQASQELLTEDNQRINQISALLSGGQVSQPNFMGANMPTIPTTDTAGLINANYDQRLAAWQQKSKGVGSVLGGLGGLFSSIPFSDDRLKKDKHKIADLDGDGTHLWAFHYKGEDSDSPMHIGLMASEVEEAAPGAIVQDPSGYRRVNYGRAMGSILGMGAH